MSEKVSEYIKEISDWRGKLLAEIRNVVLAADKGIVEEWKWNSPVWSKDGLICSASAFKNHVSISFFNGASLEDKDKLFNYGLDSKKMRTIKFEKGDKIKEKELKNLIKEAIEFNSK